MNKSFRILIGLVAAALVGTAMTACGHDSAKESQEKVDTANADLARAKRILGELSDKGVYIISPSLSADTIARMDSAALDQTDALVAEFIARGSNVIETSKRPDVSFPADQRQSWETLVANAQKIKEMIAEKKNQSNLAPLDKAKKKSSK